MLLLTWSSNQCSVLERSLRKPKVIKQLFILFFTRTFLLWFICFFCIAIFFDSAFITFILSVLSTLIIELIRVPSWYMREVFPKHQAKLSRSIETYKSIKVTSGEFYQLEIIEALVENSAWSIAHFIYLSLITFLWKNIFIFYCKYVLRLQDYSFLDMFFNMYRDKSFELSTAVYQNSAGGALDFLDAYCGRWKGFDLQIPTIREQSHEIASLWRSNVLKSPEVKALYNERLRGEWTKKLLNTNSKVSKITGFVIEKTKLAHSHSFDYIYYSSEYDFYIRELLFMYCSSKSISQKEVFDYTWQSLKSLSH